MKKELMLVTLLTVLLEGAQLLQWWGQGKNLYRIEHWSKLAFSPAHKGPTDTSSISFLLVLVSRHKAEQQNCSWNLPRLQLPGDFLLFAFQSLLLQSLWQDFNWAPPPKPRTFSLFPHLSTFSLPPLPGNFLSRPPGFWPVSLAPGTKDQECHVCSLCPFPN